MVNARSTTTDKDAHGKKELEVILNACKQYLGRELVKEDYKDFTRIFISSDTSNYTLAYKGIPIGAVRCYSESGNYCVEFIQINNSFMINRP